MRRKLDYECLWACNHSTSDQGQCFNTVKNHNSFLISSNSKTWITHINLWMALFLMWFWHVPHISTMCNRLHGHVLICHPEMHLVKATDQKNSRPPLPKNKWIRHATNQQAKKISNTNNRNRQEKIQSPRLYYSAYTEITRYLDSDLKMLWCTSSPSPSPSHIMGVFL